MFNIIVTLIASFVITFFAIPVIIQVAKDKKLFDEPGERKIHKVVIPTLGGLGIFAGFIIAYLLGTPSEAAADIRYLAAAFIVIFLLGMKDDVLILSVSKKFIGQVLAAIILYHFAGVQINNMHGFFNVYEIPEAAGLLLTLFTIIVITNSFNLIDGIDGLAGSLGLVTTSLMGVYFFLNGQTGPCIMACAMAGSLLAFLIFNFSPAKIFMGDTGSLLLGLVNAILVIKFINLSAEPTSFPNVSDAAPAIGFAILMLPLFDTLRVFTLRLIEGRSPFSPDRNHIHHFLLDLGMSHRQITLTLVGVNLLFIGLAWVIRDLGSTLMISILLVSCLLLTGIIYFLKTRSRHAQNIPSREAELIKSHKILSFASEPMEVD
jgi:UDP-N-acetylmuramyl pentapeptide phosphotransferase/UDP-N-acetylglucosamine-1-phosphate transferase